MRYEEQQIIAVIEDLRKIAGGTVAQNAQAALDTAIDGLETMRPYVRVGLRVSASDETLDAINHLYSEGALAPEQWSILMNTLKLARELSIPQSRQQASEEPLHPAIIPLFGASRFVRPRTSAATGRRRRV